MTEGHLFAAGLACIIVVVVLQECEVPALPFAQAGRTEASAGIVTDGAEDNALKAPAPAEVREVNLPPGSLYTITDLYGETWITIRCEARP